jgi:hypothetical protein
MGRGRPNILGWILATSCSATGPTHHVPGEPNDAAPEIRPEMEGEPGRSGPRGSFLCMFPALTKSMQGASIVSQFEFLLPLARDWAAEQEQRILREGVPLSETEISDAQRVGVKEPGRVRLLPVETIPSPAHPALKAACAATNLVPASPRGLTLSYGIFVRTDHWRDRGLIVHELAHIAQYERLGGIEPFLRQYLLECATVGYSNSSMEDEAIRAAYRLCVS